MDARTAMEKLAELQIVDVRDPDELEGGYIQGAVNIPLSSLSARMSEIDTERPVLVVCETGQRSYDAAEMFEDEGYEAHNLEGGMWGWNLRGLPVVNSSGETGSAGKEWKTPG